MIQVAYKSKNILYSQFQSICFRNYQRLKNPSIKIFFYYFISSNFIIISCLFLKILEKFNFLYKIGTTNNNWPGNSCKKTLKILLYLSNKYLSIDFSIFSISWAISILFMFSWTWTNSVFCEVFNIDSTKAVTKKPRRTRP